MVMNLEALSQIDTVRNAGDPLWEWSSFSKAPQISISEDGLVARRTISSGQNPAVKTSLAITRDRNRFRVKINHLGHWIGIGLADSNFVTSGNKTLGTQSLGINTGYFWQNTGIHKIQMHGEVSTDVDELQVSDIVDVYVSFELQMVFYFRNEILQGWIILSKQTISEGSLFPCINMSLGTEVSLLNFDYPTLNFQNSPVAYQWKWSLDDRRKAPVILIHHDELIASRGESPKGLNPAVMSSMKFTRSRSHFRIRILSLGKWLGVGVCDEDFIVNNYKTLGTQKNSVNAAYFFQSSGIHRLQMPGERHRDNVNPFMVSDVIDVRIDFDSNRIYFFHNYALQGYLAPTQHSLKENKLFPAVDLSTGTEVQICNDDNPELNMIRSIQRFLMKEDNVNWKRPLKQFPTQWKWDSSDQKKAFNIKIVDADQFSLEAIRDSGGSNPAIMTIEPFTRISYYFVVEILKLGSWIGIGFADLDFLLNGSKTLGQQTSGVNCSYFFQNDVRKLQMFGEKAVIGVDPIKVGDLISVRINFDTNQVYFYNNDLLQGIISCARHILKEGKLYPCVDLSVNTHVAIRNVDCMSVVVSNDLDCFPID